MDMVGALGSDYERFVVSSTRSWSMLVKDHLFCYITGGTSGVFQKIKNATTTNFTALTFCINLETGALTLMTNLALQGWTKIPDGYGTTTWFVVTDASLFAQTIKGDTLFDEGGVDAVTCDGHAVGPDFYLETKKYDMGAGQRLKLLKMLLLHYLSSGAAIKLDTVKGLGTTGTQSTSEFAASTSFTDKRIKFMKRSQYLALRLYQASSATTQLTLGAWAIGFKWKRTGRV
jgi:hypothetical protein